MGGIFLGISPDFIALSNRAGGDALDFDPVLCGGLTVSQQVFVGNAEVVHGGDFCLQVLAHGDFIIRIVGGMQHAISVSKFQTASSCGKGDGVHQQDGSVIHKVFFGVNVDVGFDGEGFSGAVHGVRFAVFLTPLHFAQDRVISVKEFSVSGTVPRPEFRIENIGVRGVCLFIPLCADRIEGEIFLVERFFGGVQETAVGLFDQVNRFSFFVITQRVSVSIRHLAELTDGIAMPSVKPQDFQCTIFFCKDVGLPLRI